MTKMRDELLRMLKGAGDNYISGQEMSRRLGVTRAAVWKHIRALESEGVEIEGVTRRGYRLKREPNLLCAATLEPFLLTKSLGRNAVFINSAPSSNILARKLADKGCEGGTIVVVEDQTQGRGRRGRGWANSPGQDICVSVVLRPDMETQYAPRFTLATALGVYGMAKKFALEPEIKWPNDVLIRGKKICGILLELQGSMEALEYIVIGFGVNVNTDVFRDEIREVATSMKLASGNTFGRARVLAELMNLLEPLFDACMRDEDFSRMLADYKNACGTLGKEITLNGVNANIHGTAFDIDSLGRLLLKDESGHVHAAAAGDVSVQRGV